MEEIKKYPFSKAFVMNTTLRHMRKSIDISINKTFARMPEFEKNSVDAEEILSTLGALHILRQMMDDFQSHNPGLFKDSK